MRYAERDKLKCARAVRSWLHSKKNKQYTIQVCYGRLSSPGCLYFHVICGRVNQRNFE